jgi:NAD-dependent SIR2 family protein deacetylase
MMTDNDLIRHAPKYSMRNKEVVQQSQQCGCYHCLKTFTPDQIQEWTDGGLTALCPHCNVDAVVPENMIPLLETIQKVWF